MPHKSSDRLSKLQSQLEGSGLIISSRENIFYLTGIYQSHPDRKEAFLFVTPSGSLLYHSPLLSLPSKPSINLLPFSDNRTDKTKIARLYSSIKTILFEDKNLTVAEHTRFKHLLKGKELKPINNLILNMRMIKDDSEIDLIKHAGKITSETMKDIFKLLKKQQHPLSEIQLARIIETKLYDYGATGLAFPVHVAFDQNTASPHHSPTDAKNNLDSIIMLDFGAQYQGYNADMTRTFSLSPTPPKQFNKIKHVVHMSYHAATNLTPQPSPLTSLIIDQSTRSIIQTAGYGDNFPHSTGHGIGLSIHEPPSLSPKIESIIKPNTTLTIEPGIYLPGKFGYRHENTYLITTSGIKKLT